VTDSWLRRLCDATASPPETDDVDALLAAWAGVVAARQAILDEAPAALAPSPLADELARRETAWSHTLAAARERVGAHRMHATQVRRYQQLPLSADS
jgi:hypothetical protein